MGTQAWIRTEGRLVRGSDSHSQLEHISDHRDMDPQYTTVDLLAMITDTIASLWGAILGLGQRIDRHPAYTLSIPGSTSHESTAPPPPPPPSGPTVQQDYTVPPPLMITTQIVLFHTLNTSGFEPFCVVISQVKPVGALRT